MAFKVQYFRDGAKVGDTPWVATQGEMIEFARAGLEQYDAHLAVILETDDDGGKVVATVNR
jgi:hypothetical protein